MRQDALYGSLSGFPNLICVTALVCKRIAAGGGASSAVNGRTSSCWPLGSASSRYRSATQWPATSSEGMSLTFDYALAGFVCAGLLFYLTYALLRPERF